MGIPASSDIGKRIAAMVDGKKPRKKAPAKSPSPGWVVVLELPFATLSENCPKNKVIRCV